MQEVEEVVKSILQALVDRLDSEQLRFVENASYIALNRFVLSKKEESCMDLTVDISPDVRAYQMFFIAKKIEGRSDKSLRAYRYTLDKFLRMFQKPLASITVNDIRLYMAGRQDVKPTTQNNERRHLSSFFTWLFVEEYIPKNPMVKIGPIKEGKVVRKPFSGKEIEELRDACTDKRDRAIIEILLSTGMRVGELSGLNRSDVSGVEVIVTGKGNKQRICYLNPSSQKRLNDYLLERNDNYEQLLLGKLYNSRAERLSVSRIEVIVREIGRSAGVDNTHPHRFRRTAASTALQRGMPIEQVRQMLGHESIETTLRYAITSDNTVKHSHSKYM